MNKLPSILFIVSVILCFYSSVAAQNQQPSQADYGHIDPTPAQLNVPRPSYFEESWAILSSIGLLNVMFGVLVIGIIDVSPVATIPIIVSAAGAIANGLCYYAFYGDYSTHSSVIAAVISDVMWMIQEAGMSFYSYLILIRVLSGRPRAIFLSIFWGLMAIILVLRVLILTSRANDLLNSSANLQNLVDHLHMGYFAALAAVECVSTFFLLRKFAAARRSTVQASGIFPYLMRSTEIRLGTLAIVGITRAITYTWRVTPQEATSVPEQIDRFVYTIECMFPVMMFIDLLGTRTVMSSYQHKSSRTPLSSASRMGGRRTSSLGTLSWAKSDLVAIAASPQGSPSVELPGHVVEGQKLITGFDFAFAKEREMGFSRTVNFRPHAG